VADLLYRVELTARPKIVQAGWSDAPFAIGEQRTFTNGRIIVAGGKVRRGKQRVPTILLYYRRDFPWPSSRPRKPVCRLKRCAAGTRVRRDWG
jgi:hypothetical protein